MTRTIWAIGALVFIASAGATMALCASMAGDMPMPGGWTMSMIWMKGPGQTWPGAAASFLGMWIVMMVAMMLPSLGPTLWHYGRSRHEAGDQAPARAMAIAAAGYFAVWAIDGLVAYALGVLVAAAAMRSASVAQAMPLASGIVLIVAGSVQLTSRKARLLEHSVRAPQCAPDEGAGAAWRYGVRLGIECSLCCIGFMAILLTIGVMNLAAMAVIAAAITLERLAPNPRRAAVAAGIIAIAVGAFVVARGVASFAHFSVGYKAVASVTILR